MSPTRLSLPTVHLPRWFGYTLLRTSRSIPRRYFYLRFGRLPLSLATTRGISFDFFSSPYLDVSVRGVPLIKLCIHLMIHNSSLWVFPHSDTRGSMLICSSPRLFAAYRVLLRLPVPRHSPYALIRLNFLWGCTFLFIHPCCFSFFELLEFHKHF